MHASFVLTQNIRDLLRERHHDQRDLAFWCKKTETWISQALNHKRNLQIADLDNIAAFFGLTTYQLFQPGIATKSETERRSGKDRRSGVERRTGPSGRMPERQLPTRVAAAVALLNQEVDARRDHKTVTKRRRDPKLQKRFNNH